MQEYFESNTRLELAQNMSELRKSDILSDVNIEIFSDLIIPHSNYDIGWCPDWFIRRRYLLSAAMVMA